jgi:hypothetical protein
MRPAPHVALLLLALIAAPARADSARERARLLVREGNRLIDRGQCKLALERFELARTSYPDGYKIDVNLGTALECLGEHARAADHFERFLVRASEANDAEMVRAVRARLEALRGKLTVLTVSCPIAGAAVAVDGVTVGRTPLARRLYLAAGTDARITVTKQGYPRFEATVTAHAGMQQTIGVPWQPRASARPRPQPPAALFVPDATVDLHRAPPRRRATPVYRRWWFWTLLGAGVVAVTATTAAIAASRSGDPWLPSGELGRVEVR